MLRRKKMDRKAWIQMVEAAVSMLLLFGMTLSIMNDKSEKPDIAKNAYKIQHEILSEAENDPCIRNELMGCTKQGLREGTCSGTLLKNFIAKRLCHLPYNFTVNLCDPTQACLFPQKDEKGNDKEKPKDEIYAADIVIASNLTTFSPVKISMFAWTGGTPCEEYECNLSAPVVQPPHVPVCGNGIVETGEECEGSSTREVWYNDKGRTNNCKRIDSCQNCKWVNGGVQNWNVVSAETPALGLCINSIDDDCNGGAGNGQVPGFPADCKCRSIPGCI
jgi:hypothetical protein